MGKIGLQTQDKYFNKSTLWAMRLRLWHFPDTHMVFKNWPGHESKEFRIGISQFQIELCYWYCLTRYKFSVSISSSIKMGMVTYSVERWDCGFLRNFEVCLFYLSRLLKLLILKKKLARSKHTVQPVSRSINSPNHASSSLILLSFSFLHQGENVEMPPLIKCKTYKKLSFHNTKDAVA